MKLLIPPERAWIFDRLPRKGRPPFAEIAAVQFFKLAAWAAATAGIYLLQERSGSSALALLPYVVWLLIVWDMNAKLGYEPDVERTENELFVLLPLTYWLKLCFIALFSGLVAWAVVFWLAPMIHKFGLAAIDFA